MPHLHHVAPSLREASWTMAVAPPFHATAVVAGAVDAALVGPRFNQTSNELPLPGLNSMVFLLDQLVHYLFCHSDEEVIIRRKSGAPSIVRLLFDRSVVLFSFTDGDLSLIHI